MKYEIFRYKDRWVNENSYAIVKKFNFVRFILTKDGKWATLGQANRYSALYEPKSFPTIEEAKKYTLNKNKSFGMFERVSDEEIALKELKQ